MVKNKEQDLFNFYSSLSIAWSCKAFMMHKCTNLAQHKSHS